MSGRLSIECEMLVQCHAPLTSTWLCMCATITSSIGIALSFFCGGIHAGIPKEVKSRFWNVFNNEDLKVREWLCRVHKPHYKSRDQKQVQVLLACIRTPVHVYVCVAYQDGRAVAVTTGHGHRHPHMLPRPDSLLKSGHGSHQGG